MSLSERLKSTIRDVVDYPSPGIIFKDITTVLADAQLMRDVVTALLAQFKGQRVDAIAAVEARGFIFGAILAHELGCKFIPVRKAGKLPYNKKSMDYALEYGHASVEMHTDAVEQGWKVWVHDDLLATGGTAAAAGTLIQSLGGDVAGFSFLINLSFLPGENILTEQFDVKPQYLLSY